MNRDFFTAASNFADDGRIFLQTGLPALDHALQGGLDSGQLIEISVRVRARAHELNDEYIQGAAGTGKTQFCMHIIAQVRASRSSHS